MPPVDSPWLRNAGLAPERAAAQSTPTPYVPPTGDEPLDAIEEALVRMWIDIFENKIRADVAATPEAEQDRPSVTTGAAPDARRG